MAEADLRTYLNVLRRRAHWVLITTVVVVIAVIGVDHLRTKQYTATAQLLVQPASTVNNAVTQQTVSSTQVLTELQLLTSEPVKLLVQKKLGVATFSKIPPAAAAESGQTNVITVSAKSTSPQEAREIADAYATSFVSYEQDAAIQSQTAAESQLQSQIDTLNRQIAALEASPSSTTSTTSSVVSPQLQALLSQQEVLKEELAQLQVNGAVSTGNVQLVSSATTPTAPSSPKPLRDSLIALVLGLLLGIGLALLIEHFDDAIYGKEDAEEYSGGLPVLSMIPKLTDWKAKEQAYLIATRKPTSPVTESYRSLRTAMQFANHDGTVKVTLVTSPSAAEGKTSTVANLGTVLAGANQRTLLVACDLRRPRLGQFLELAETPGFTSVLLGNVTTAEAIAPVPGVPNMFVLPSGEVPPNPAELLASTRAAELMNELRSLFDLILIDSPPLIPVADALILSELVDATLLVVAAGQTTRAELKRATELLDQVKAPRVGLVLNEVTRRAGYAYGYGYGYASSPTPSAADSDRTHDSAATLQPLRLK